MEKNNSELRILIVDDVPKNIQVLGSILMSRSYNISFAPNGFEAIELALTNELDLILLDVMMPGIDGFETCRRLKQNPETKDIPVIFMTALSDTSDKVQGFEAGAVDYITKPYEAEEVLARVNTHLKIRTLEKTLEERIKDLELHNNFIRRTFGRYLSDEVVANLLQTPEGLVVGGDELDVTILMSDIRGFSSITENLRPEQVVSMLNMYLSAMTDVIIKYEGTIDEFIGDAILVIFGAPIRQEDHADRAVACAIEMQQAIDKLNEDYINAGHPSVEIGIGINTGEVIVGNIGSAKRAKYGVVGRNVNIVSRIESYTVGRQILISDSTKMAGKGIMEIQNSIKVNPKGVKEPIMLHDIKGISGKYNLRLDTEPDVFYPLRQPLELSYIILDEKSADQVPCKGKLIKISRHKAVMITAEEIPLFSNLKIQFSKQKTEDAAVYGKVTGNEEENIILHFTHKPETLDDIPELSGKM